MEWALVMTMIYKSYNAGGLSTQVIETSSLKKCEAIKQEFMQQVKNSSRLEFQGNCILIKEK